MNNYTIITDAAASLLTAQVEQYDLRVVPMRVHVDKEEFSYSYGSEGLNMEDFYNRMKAGAATGTVAVNPADWECAIRQAFDAGLDALVIPFTSALSSTCANAAMAAQTLQEEYPQRKALVVDSLCADFGQGMLVCHAAENRLAGMSLEDNAAWVLENRLQQIHWFTVDDLQYLRRGGRISAATAVVGAALGIKPILHVDNEGRLVSVGKTRGRKRALQTLLDKVGETAIRPQEQVMFICQADCMEDAQAVAQTLKDRYGVRDVIINHTGPVAGAHSGPGTLALFYVGTER